MAERLRVAMSDMNPAGTALSAVVLTWYKGWRRVRGRWGGTERAWDRAGDSANDRGLRLDFLEAHKSLRSGCCILCADILN